MSSDLYVFDGTFFLHSSPEMVSSDGDLFFSDPFSPFCESSIDILQELSNSQNGQNPIENSTSVDQFTPDIPSSSPPSYQLENLSLCQSIPLEALTNGPNLENCTNFPDGYGDFSGLNDLQVKAEECQVGLNSVYGQSFVPHSYSGSAENVAKMMQRSYSSNSFDGKPCYLFQPRFDSLMESANYQSQALTSPENSFFSGQMRRVCSTGDLQNLKAAHATTQRSLSSPLATENSFMDQDANFKVGRYSAEERKERISKYRAKRTLRNFNKTIKYACRKTLADNRPRIRGRFARNDETGEIPKAACSTRDEDEDELWFDGLHEEEDDRMMRSGGVNHFGQTQFQYYGYS